MILNSTTNLSSSTGISSAVELMIGACQKLPVGQESAQSAAVAATYVRLVATIDCFVALGADPTAVADGSCVFCAAHTPEVFAVTSGWTIAVIGLGNMLGDLFITALS